MGDGDGFRLVETTDTRTLAGVVVRSCFRDFSPCTLSCRRRAVDFLRILHNLKATKRTGWVRKGVEGPESIADHMYRMSVMAMIAPDAAGGLDRDRCIK